MGSTKGTTKSQGNKDKFDRFYTDVDEASRLTSYLITYLHDSNIIAEDVSLDSIAFVEPSAGSGSFVYALEQVGATSIAAYDIAPVPSDKTVCTTSIQQQDFLSPEFSLARPDDSTFLIAIGNPPFGTGGTLAFQFVAKCMESCDVVAFIMPPSACKDSAKSKTGKARMRNNIDVQVDDYSIPTGDTINVPSKFVIYTPITDEDRAQDKKEKEQDAANIAALPFSFTSKAKAKDAQDAGKKAFSIRRVGGTSGQAKDTIELSDQSNYFCVMKDDATRTFEDVAKALEAPIAERDLSVGPRSLSKAEIARALSQRLGSEHDNGNDITDAVNNDTDSASGNADSDER